MTPVERVPTTAKLSDMQFLVASLLGLNYNYTEIGRELRISPLTVKSHAEFAAQKIPGDLPVAEKLRVWVRGATREVLEGTSLKVEVLTRGTGRRVEAPLVAEAGVTPTS